MIKFSVNQYPWEPVDVCDLVFVDKNERTIFHLTINTKSNVILLSDLLFSSRQSYIWYNRKKIGVPVDTGGFLRK